MSDIHESMAAVLARGYCHEENQHKPVDASLILSMACEVWAHLDSIEQSNEYRRVIQSLNALHLMVPPEVVADVRREFDALINVIRYGVSSLERESELCDAVQNWGQEGF